MIKIVKIFGVGCLFLGILYPSYYFLKGKVDNYQYEVLVDRHIEDENYYGVLVIDKIDLKREFYPIDSKENQVDKNILLHSSSRIPDGDGSNFIFAAHSGNGENAYFKDLYLLDIGDEVQVYYEGQIWIYEIMEIEYQDKTGILYLKEEYEDMITLITCTKNDSNTQTIYYGILKTSQNL